MNQHFLELLEGEFDNFQQVWQQNTEVPSHVVLTNYPHRCIHQIIRLVEIQSELYDCIFEVKYYLNRNMNVSVLTELWAVVDDEMVVFELTDNETITAFCFEDNRAKDLVVWKESEKGIWTGQGKSRSYRLTANVLEILDDNLFANGASKPSIMTRCRFFSGWIEIPDTVNPETVYRFPNLRLHDQGAKVQLINVDGTLGKYTVELTQLIFGHTIFIMKLAIYELPIEAIDYNSHSIAYTWTNPEAERIGINLRYIISGWTLENKGLGVSQNP